MIDAETESDLPKTRGVVIVGEFELPATLDQMGDCLFGQAEPLADCAKRVPGLRGLSDLAHLSTIR